MALSNSSFSPKPAAPPVKKPRKKRVAAQQSKKKIDNVAAICNSSGKDEPVEVKIEIEKDTYYWALYCGEPEIILTNHNGAYFYMHGDEYSRKVDNTLLEVKKKIGSRAEMIKRIEKRNKENWKWKIKHDFQKKL